MVTVSRRVNERMVIGDDIRVTVVAIAVDNATLEITGPDGQTQRFTLAGQEDPESPRMQEIIQNNRSWHDSGITSPVSEPDAT